MRHEGHEGDSMRDGEGDDSGEPTATEDLLYDVIRRLWPLHRTIVRAVERELADTGLTAA